MPVPFNVYEFFRFIIPGGYFVALLYILVALILGIPISYDVLSYQTVVYFFAAFIVSIVIDSRDLIQYSKGWFAEADFFQRQFPSKYLLDRCGSCEKKESCSNHLTNDNFIPTWFYFFNEHLPEYLRNAVLTSGYLCRVVFYVHLFSLSFFYLGLLYPILSLINGSFSFWTLAYSGILFVIVEALFFPNRVGKKGERWLSIFFSALDPSRLFVAVFVVLGFVNRHRKDSKSEEDESALDPRGMWPRWKRYNDVQIRWMEMNEPLLVEKICGQE